MKRQMYEKRGGHLGDWERFVIAMTAGSVAAATVTPADVIKTRIQGPDGHLYRGNWHCFKVTLESEGFRALWKGLTPRLFTRGKIDSVAVGGKACSISK